MTVRYEWSKDLCEKIHGALKGPSYILCYSPTGNLSKKKKKKQPKTNIWTIPIDLHGSD